MSISFTNMLHGATILILLESLEKYEKISSYKLFSNESKSSYILSVCINNNKKINIGLYLKHSRNRLSPWGFSFKDYQQEEINTLSSECDTIFILLITNQEGVAVVNAKVLPKLFNKTIDESEWISVSRKIRQNFRVSSKDGVEKMIIPKNSFPNQIIEFLDEFTNISKKKFNLEKLNFFNK